MYRLPARIVFPAAAAATVVNLNPDNPAPTKTEAVMNKKMAEYKRKNPESGWDRLKTMFEKDEWGNMSPGLSNITNSTVFACAAGAAYGGYMSSRNVFLDFMERNQATAFVSHREAQRHLQSKVSLSYGKGAWAMGWRVGLFTFVYMSMTNGIARYRGKDGFLEFSAGGAAVGALFRVHLGVRAMIVGCGLGAILGTGAGVITKTLLWATGFSMGDIQQWHYEWNRTRDASIKHTMDTYKRETEMNQIIVQKIEEDEKKNRFLDTLKTIQKISSTEESSSKTQAPVAEETVKV